MQVFKNQVSAHLHENARIVVFLHRVATAYNRLDIKVLGNYSTPYCGAEAGTILIVIITTVDK